MQTKQTLPLQKLIHQKYGVTAENATIADILFIAANEFLHCNDYDPEHCCVESYSCCAVTEAFKAVYGFENYGWYFVRRHPILVRIRKGLAEMGVKVSSVAQYKKFKGNYEAMQQARYTWLMFAHEMALEQGV